MLAFWCYLLPLAAGIIPHGHLADGRMYLVMVSKCSHLEWLHFLLRLSSEGLVDGCLPYVRVSQQTAVQGVLQGLCVALRAVLLQTF
jgi:hypothetical protein